MLDPALMLEGLPEISTKKLPDGIQGNKETIKVMTKVARERAGHPVVQTFARNILLSYHVPSQDYVDEALAIGDYVLKHVRYVRDPDGIEQLQDPVTMIDQITRGISQGDCDDMALLIATLLIAIGHQPYFRAVRYKDSSGPYNHIYVVVYERNWGSPKMRVVLDAILKRAPIGTEVRHKSGDEYPA